MSYCPSGPPESQHRDIWVSGKVGDSRSRCIATSLHQKGYEVGQLWGKNHGSKPIESDVFLAYATFEVWQVR